MRKSREYRHEAAAKVNQFVGTIVVSYLIMGLIIGAVSATGIGNLIVTGPLTLGFILLLIKAAKGDKPEISDLFKGFSDFVRAIIAYVLQAIYIALWSILFVIPGIIKSYSYSMTYFILTDDPDIDGGAAITKSRQLMKGHKWQLFCLDLSYIGWYILSIFTLGILLLWVEPKHQMARYLFYLDICGKKEESSEELEEKEF